MGAHLAAAVLAALLGTAAVGCTTGPDRAPDAARIAAVRELREAVGPPASELGAAAATLASVMRELHAGLDADPSRRRAAAEAVRERTLPRLEDAAAALAVAPLDGDGPDETAAREARVEVLAAAETMAGQADRELDRVELAAAADERLAALVAAWDEPGSRSQQLERLAATAAAAEELAEELAGVRDVPACSHMLRRRVAAARTVVATSRELRELVAARRGEAFDARRAEEPELSLVADDRAEVGCIRREGSPAAGAEVVAALDGLEAALNPPELAPPQPTGTAVRSVP